MLGEVGRVEDKLLLLPSPRQDSSALLSLDHTRRSSVRESRYEVALHLYVIHAALLAPTK